MTISQQAGFAISPCSVVEAVQRRGPLWMTSGKTGGYGPPTDTLPVVSSSASSCIV